MQSKFIVFEGPDGSGKTTQMERVAAVLSAEGFKIRCECEPTHGAIGKKIREALSGVVRCLPETLALLFAADRCEHINDIMLRMERGETILCDRYVFSSIAYQGLELDDDWIREINTRATERLMPDAVVYIDLPTETCMERIDKNRDHTEIFETAERIAKVRENYNKAFDMYKDLQLIHVNGDQAADEVTRDIIFALRSKEII